MYTEPIYLKSTTVFHSNEILICATEGYLFALQKSNGSIIWKREIVSPSIKISLCITDTDAVIVGALDKTISIDIMTGKNNWINSSNTEGLKKSIVLAVPSPQLQSSNTEDLPPPYDGHYEPQPSELQSLEYQPSESQPSESQLSQYTPFIITLCKGLVTAFHPKSGIIQWKYALPKHSHRLPVAIIDPPRKHTNRPVVFIGISHTVYSLDAETGKLNWGTQLSYETSSSKYIALASS